MSSSPIAGGTVAHKFGGSSLADATCFRQVAANLRERDDDVQVVVVSAMHGVTNALIALANAASQREPGWADAWAGMRDRHLAAAAELCGESGATNAWLQLRFEELHGLLNALSVLGAPSREALELVQGLGEVYSARMLADFLRAGGDDCACLDARDVLVVAQGELGVSVDWPRSSDNLSAWRKDNPQSRVVVTGFVARDAAGRATTLGRNGSDFSGAIFAVLFDARELHIWTDVDGVLSADPRVVPEAVTLPTLSYNEACELAYFGAKVIHPQTMTPALARGLPIHHPQHLPARAPGHAHRRRQRTGRPGEGPDLVRRPGPAQCRRRRHDRRARHGATLVRCPARRRRVGGDDFPGLVGAFDLLRDPRRRIIAGAGGRVAGLRPGTGARAVAGRVDHAATSACWRSSATAWPARRASLRACSMRSAVPASTCARSPRAPANAIFPWPWPVPMPRGPCAPPMPASGCRRRRSRSASSAPARSAWPCWTNCTKPFHACAARPTSTCACVPWPTVGKCGSSLPRCRRTTAWRNSRRRHATAISTPSPTTCAPNTCRTRSSSTAVPATRSPATTPAGWRAAST